MSGDGFTEGDAKAIASRLLASVLDLPGLGGVEAPLVEPVGKGLQALAKVLEGVSTAEGFAARAVSVAISPVIGSAATVGVAIAESTRAARGTTPSPDPTPPPWPDLLVNLLSELAEEVAPDDRELKRIVREVLNGIGTELTGLTAAAAATPPGGGPIPEDIVRRVEREIAKRAEKIKRLIQRLDRVFGRLNTKRFQAALLLASLELQSSARDRAVVAALMSVPGFLADLAMNIDGGVRETPSSFSLGNEVHENLQAKYRAVWATGGCVLEDGIVYRAPGAGVDLAKDARARRDGSLFSLLFARLPERGIQQVLGRERMAKVWAIYREDVLDLRCGEVWEIKPMRSAAVGVYQELQYRTAFNLMNALLQDICDIVAAGPMKGLLRTRARFFTGLKFSREAPIIGGLDLNWQPFKSAFSVGRGQGRPLLAVPLTVPQLPGLLLYVLLQLPAELLAILSTVLAKRVADAIEKAAQEYVRIMEQVLQALAQIALAALCALAMVAVFILFGEILGFGAVATRALAALGEMILQYAPVFAVAAGSGSPLDSLVERARAAKLKLAQSPRLIGDELVIQLAPIEAPAGRVRIPVIDVSIGNVRFLGLPASQVPLLEALAQIGAAIGTGVYRRFLGDEPPTA